MTLLTRPRQRIHGALLPLVGHEQRVPLVQGGTARYVNLDSAASTPALQVVADHVADVLPFYASVHRGAGYHSQVCTRLYEEARGTIGAFVGAASDDVVILTRNTTDALNLLASAVPGDVVVLDVEHHANLLPWQRRTARVITATDTVEGTLDALAAELRRSPAALLTVTGASNVTGEILPLRQLADLAHAHGARLAVDGAQLVPHRRIDLSDLGVDYLAFSGHKIYAPYGAGVLIGPRDWLDQAPPHLAGGGAVRNVEITQTTWAASPGRHEGGTPNLLGALALAAACTALAALDPDALQSHEVVLRDELEFGLARLGIAPLEIWQSTPAVGILTFQVDGWEACQVATYLSAEHGIGVRDGRFCAHPLMARLGHPDGAVRVSFGVGSSVEDVTQLLRALRALINNGRGWSYLDRPGSSLPVPDPRPSPHFGDLR